MLLKKLRNQELLHITERDKILGYKISRTEDKRLILEIKVDISDSLMDVETIEEKGFQE